MIFFGKSTVFVKINITYLKQPSFLNGKNLLFKFFTPIVLNKINICAESQRFSSNR